MSLSMKQITKALNEAAQANKQPKQSKNAKRKAKRKVKRAAMAGGGGPSVPGTVSIRTPQTNFGLVWPFKHREYLGTLKLGTDGTLQGSFFMSPFSLTWLKGVSGNFEKYRWTSFVVEYVPDVGTTNDGSLALGIDWGTSNAKAGVMFNGKEGMLADAKYTRQIILAMTPSLVTPFWKPAVIRVPGNVLQTRRWYSVPTAAVTSATLEDQGPGFIAYYASGKASLEVGDLWVSYGLEFAGTRSA